MDLIALIWFGAMLFFLLLESGTVCLMSIWFAAGALVAAAASLLGAELWLQILLFVAVSAVLLALLRPVVRKHFTPKLTKTNVDSLVGSAGIVCEEVNNLQGTGRVKLSGMDWAARSSDGSVLAPDTLVRVDRIEGVKLFVSAQNT